jgi:hypothetical protein
MLFCTINTVACNATQYSALKKYDVWHSLNQNTKVEPFFSPGKYILTVHDVNFMEEGAAKIVRKMSVFLKKN